MPAESPPEVMMARPGFSEVVIGVTAIQQIQCRGYRVTRIFNPLVDAAIKL